jgi:hypothetical protein
MKSIIPPEVRQHCPHKHGARTHHKQNQYQEQTLTDVSSVDVTGKATHTVWTPALHRGSWSYKALNALTQYKATDTFFWRVKYSFKHHRLQYTFIQLNIISISTSSNVLLKTDWLVVYVKRFFACKDYTEMNEVLRKYKIWKQTDTGYLTALFRSWMMKTSWQIL